jgi:FtsP/CotA-like multicopper oxidase with cupredoxin domain
MGNLIAVRGQAQTLMTPSALAANLYADNAAIGADPTCQALAPGHRRRVFFNVPADNPDGFGLGYEEVDAKGVPVPGTFIDVHPFDPMTPTVCVPLAAGNAPVKEVWEIVNLANEQHNFHIHQTKFRIISASEIDGTGLPSHVSGDGVLVDNFPMRETDGTCVTVQDWRNGVCKAYPALVEIPFAIAGDFVYHCHILEHEDGGMMARIRVRPNPANSD